MNSVIKKVEAELKTIICDQEYPYGSCQYEMVRKGYLIGIELKLEEYLKLIPDSEKREFEELMNHRGNKEYFLRRMKFDLLSNFVISFESSIESQVNLINDLLDGNLSKINDPDFYCNSVESSISNEILVDIQGLKTIQEVIDFQINQSYDLWSISLGIPIPEINWKNNGGSDRDVRSGFNIGLALAAFEISTRKTYNWGEWDT